MIVELILPAHNEGKSIRAAIEGFFDAASRAPYELHVLVTEDGSVDDTRAVVEAVAAEHPGRVRITAPSGRKGYSQAMVDAIPMTDCDLVAFCDSDRQFDPSELEQLVAAVDAGRVVSGCRTPRSDSAFRIACSNAFGLVYRALIGLRMDDPSSPFVALTRTDLLRFAPARTHLAYGFWWEFFARARAAGLDLHEIAVSHQPRADGTTQVYRLRKLPGIVGTHLRGLITLRRELRGTMTGPVPAGEVVTG
ncbi:MAG TPA: glycosyltransferase family 2 protein [Gaiellaceae bacterium]|nr:glycosyltransferase family 2 protein [Gaiellaceae bacterium]